MNFTLLSSRNDLKSFYLLNSFDKCLYKKNGSKRTKTNQVIQYYVCRDCDVKGRVYENSAIFEYTSKHVIHSHNPPESFKEYVTYLNQIKSEVASTSRPARDIYNDKLPR